MSRVDMKCKGGAHVVTAQNVTDGVIKLPCVELAPVGAFVKVERAGAAVAWDGVVALGGNSVTVDNTGATDWAAADVITVIAF